MLIRRCLLILAVFIFAASTEPSADPLHVGPNGSELGLQKGYSSGGNVGAEYCAGTVSHNTSWERDEDGRYSEVYEGFCTNANGLVWVSVDLIKSYADRLSAGEKKIIENDETIKMLKDDIRTLSINNDALIKRLNELELARQ